MRTSITEIIDLALTQAIERYAEMDAHNVRILISDEWPEQIAILLNELFFRSTCANRDDVPHFVPLERNNGHGNYMAPLCLCEFDISYEEDQ